MTQDPSYPPPGDPALSFQGAAPTLPLEQPGSIRALSITAICLGGLWTLCGALSTVGALVGALAQSSGKPNPFAPPAATPPPSALTAYNMVGSVIALLLSIVELAFGIGGLGLKAWARQLGIAWSIISILWAVAGTAIALLWAIPLSVRSLPANPLISSKFLVTLSIASFVLCLILPALILIFWTRPAVKNAFEQSAMVPGY